MTRIWYDTEFVEDGRTIDLISIGMIREKQHNSERELYLISSDSRVIDRAVRHPWLRENVIPKLPVKLIPEDSWTWDHKHPDFQFVVPRSRIAIEVRALIQDTSGPQLRAWYADYDHVVLCQLWGPMACLPKDVPMWTYDLKQEASRLGNPWVPKQDPATEHHALEDARHARVIDEALDKARLKQQARAAVIHSGGL